MPRKLYPMVLVIGWLLAPLSFGDSCTCTSDLGSSCVASCDEAQVAQCFGGGPALCGCGCIGLSVPASENPRAPRNACGGTCLFGSDCDTDCLCYGSDVTTGQLGSCG